MKQKIPSLQFIAFHLNRISDKNKEYTIYGMPLLFSKDQKYFGIIFHQDDEFQCIIVVTLSNLNFIKDIHIQQQDRFKCIYFYSKLMKEYNFLFFQVLYKIMVINNIKNVKKIILKNDYDNYYFSFQYYNHHRYETIKNIEYPLNYEKPLLYTPKK